MVEISCAKKDDLQPAEMNATVVFHVKHYGADLVLMTDAERTLLSDGYLALYRVPLAYGTIKMFWGEVWWIECMIG